MAESTTFALLFCNRGFFPASLQASARQQMQQALEALGHEALMLPADATPNGAVETPADGRLYAEFLRQHRGEFDGVIVCLPNFGDENGAVVALEHADVPILVQAYPDDLDKMAPQFRRDAFCGKFSIMDVFCQHGLKFTALEPHTVHPSSPAFAENIDHFARLCRVVGGMKEMTMGSIGARTSAFKTVRIDELTLQRHGINTETMDLSSVFNRMEALDADDADVRAKAKTLKGYSSWEAAPEQAFDRLVRLGVVLDRIIDELGLDALAVRCWIEMQEHLGISPCVLLSEMNDRGVVTACEVDVGSAVMMYALHLASGDVAACLDWNNNYGDEQDKCILFHCGSAPQKIMIDKGRVSDHAIVANALGAGQGWGCNVGRIAPADITFGNVLTRDGRMEVYLGQGRFTGEPIPEDFFGCAGVAEIPNLQPALRTIGLAGHRHHVGVTPGHVLAPTHEALVSYLGYDVTIV